MNIIGYYLKYNKPVFLNKFKILKKNIIFDNKKYQKQFN